MKPAAAFDHVELGVTFLHLLVGRDLELIADVRRAEAKIVGAWRLSCRPAPRYRNRARPSRHHRRVDRTMCVLDRCTIVTSTSPSQSAAAMSCARLFEPITTTFAL